MQDNTAAQTRENTLRGQPMRGQLEFPIVVECAHCNTPHGAHQHWCQHAKLTERQRMMS